MTAHIKKSGKLITLLVLCMASMLSGCTATSGAIGASKPFDLREAEAMPAQDIRLPSADGVVTFEESGVTIDASNTSDGYIMARSAKNDKRLKLRLEANGNTYTYDLFADSEWDTFPLQAGDGGYKLTVYRQVEGTTYSVLMSKSFDVKLENEMDPFLYPSQIVPYNGDSVSVKAGFMLAEKGGDAQKTTDRLYKYVADNISYDNDKAATVQEGYLPDPDETLESGKGICYDYSSLLATFLRTHDLPTKLVMGYVSADEYHAWNVVYINGKWQTYDATKRRVGADYSADREY